MGIIVNWVLEKVTELGGMIEFLGDILRAGSQSFRQREYIFDQTLHVLGQSLATTAFAGFFVGAIMTLQFTLQVQVFGALPYLGGLVTSGTIREVGPLLIAFLLSGKIGAYTSAELGTMKVTEQIDAIRCLGADPIKEIIVPRFFGIIIASFLLLTMGLMCSFFGGVIMSFGFSSLPWEQYIRHIPTIMTFHSALNGLVKCLAFSLVISTVCTYRGYVVFGGAREVGEGVVRAATQTMITLVCFDWLSSYMMERILSVKSLGFIEFISMIYQIFEGLLTRGLRWKEVVKHLDYLAYRSLNIIVVCVTFAAAVSILEASYHMKMIINDDSLVPGFAAMLIVRELAVVVTCLLLAAKIGAGIAAEVGQMKISEQIEALKLLGIDPVNFLVLPRFVACLIAGALLALIANGVCQLTALGVTVFELDQSAGFYFMSFRRFVMVQDLVFSVIKGVVFCGLIPLVSCYYGFHCDPGAAGVGRATTKSVVTSSIAIIILDFVLTYIFSLFY